MGSILMSLASLSVTATQLASTAPLAAAALSQHTKILASDAFAGRAPGTAGEAQTLRYLITQFTKAGAQPTGDHGGWTQEVPFRRHRLDKRPGFAAVPLNGVSLSTSFAVQVESEKTFNVLARLPGRLRPDETFVYTAHWDHLGRGKPDSTGDTIYNGAMDNAVGVAGLLELARAFAAAPRTARSQLFIATTLEENGLLGAEFYATHPRFPLDKTVGGINMDAVNVFGPTPTLEMTGIGRTTLEDDLARALARQGRRLQPDPNAVVGFYYRSDHFPFVKRGVPFVFAGSGWELEEKKAPNTRDPQLGTRFHQPSDEWTPELDFEAAARDLRVYYEVGRALTESAEWPTWKPGAEFQALRETSAAARRR